MFKLYLTLPFSDNYGNKLSVKFIIDVKLVFLIVSEIYFSSFKFCLAYISEIAISICYMYQHY